MYLGACVACGAVVPRGQFELCPSARVNASIWGVPAHPGATNSSGCARVIAKALELLFDRMNAEERALALAAGGAMPPPRKVLAGGGSAAAMGFPPKVLP